MCWLTSERGQSTVEATALLGVLMLLFALLAQPVCLQYTLAIMSHAAGETARVVATSQDDANVRAFALRRLAAVPEASVFHVGGERDWRVCAQVSADDGTARVLIEGHARPLPLFGAVSTLVCERDSVGVVLRVEIEQRVRPEWLEGGYGDWMSCWR